MPGSGFGGTDVPSAEGTAYGLTELAGPGEVEIILPVGADTSSWVLKAPSTNTDTVYIGWDSDVDSSTGYPMAPRESISVSINNSAQPIYGVSASSGDELRFLAVE